MKYVYFVLASGSDQGPVDAKVFLNEKDAHALLDKKVRAFPPAAHKLSVESCPVDEGKLTE